VPSWGEVLVELNESAKHNNGTPNFDRVRRRHLNILHNLTKRDTIIYYTDWLEGTSGGPVTSITLEDMQGMMEVCRGLKGPELDLILHSPGGSPEATASIVRYLRQKFTDIRVFVPVAAMSAATMWALACDEIVMGKHSQLGPIDPQLVTAQGSFPTRAIIRQFDRAVEECQQDPSRLPGWVPILQQYGPALIEQCEAAEQLGRDLVTQWLSEHMLKDKPDEAAAVAKFFSDWDQHRSHSLGIVRSAVEELGLNVSSLEEEQKLQDAVLSVHHATMHTLGGPALKIVENHLGRAFVKLGGAIQIQVPTPGPALLPQQIPPLQLPPQPS
jgi:Serine dehydrogenase proteinase